jgi:hypothetical protein
MYATEYPLTHMEKQMKTRQLFIIITSILIVTTWSTTTQAAPVYIVEGGFLTGINNVDINGSNYDVVFKDGVFQDIFDISNPSSFTPVNSNDASRALALTMIDVAEGNFGTNPLLTLGCAADNCQIRTPFDYAFGTVSSDWFRNAALMVDDERGNTDFLPTYNSTGNAVVFAQWSTSPVPLPPSLILFLSGLIGINILGRRKTNNNHKH